MYTNIIHNDDICNYFLKNQQFIFNSLGNCRECRMKTWRISLWADRQANLIPASFYKNFLWPLREFIYVNLSECHFHRVKSLYAFG